MISKRTGLAALAAAAILMAGCGGEDEPAPADAAGEPSTGAVTIKTFMYEPDPVEVQAGTTVSWTNEDDILHTVTAGERDRPTEDFDERLDGAGSTAEITFDRRGTHEYFCSVHAGMDGSVIVR